ncbi:hypothetical protein Dred_1801 [Desulforamulus reducens MI-1]|uniref:Uncharacterized protein n=1 Tax=Desulforamulus reducens (strain ATCC BAA-1160 / DSM 100696 / MI-1) TaxID=349161 RepID=A4J5H3_DESRM|nr:hypothetical protein [Desulforamulus reducens]ABO50326.1 hypothetical protein Dred_1801 [Desulforamulus reducens MI-1]
MIEQTKVVNLEQEMVNKNTDLFVNITEIIGELLKRGLATISFNYTDCAITFATTPEVQRAFAQYSVERVQSITDEVIDITLKLLENQELTMLNQAQDAGKAVHGTLQKKISTVKKFILNNRLHNAYAFYSTSIGNVLDQFIAQKVVKPATDRYDSLETVMVKLTTKDNMDNRNRQSISFEMYGDQVDEVIETLKKIKQDILSSSNQDPQ